MRQRAQPPPPSVLWVEPDDEPVVLRPPRRRRRIGVLLTLLVLALGAAALDWLERESADQSAPAVAATRTAPAPAPVGPRDTIGIERRVLPPRPPVIARPRPTPSRPRPRPRLPVAPLAPGRLFVGATPWGDLYVDDQLVGHTPIAGVAIPAGVHRLRIVRDGFQPFDSLIQIASGQDFRLTDIALRPLAP